MTTSESIDPSQVWDKAAEVYRERGFVLVLGAGMSLLSGFPTWTELIRRLGERSIGEASAELINELEKIGYSYPAIAGIIRSTWRSDSPSFLELVREELYRGFPFFRGILALQENEFVEFVKQGNPTLRAVAALCAVRRSDARFRRNPLIHGIVNFNLDAVLRN